MDCAAINAEVQANNKKVIELGGEEGAKVAQNVAAGVAGLFIWPLWFAMDFQGAAPKEIAALQARQQYLATLAEQRCGAVPPCRSRRCRRERSQQLLCCACNIGVGNTRFQRLRPFSVLPQVALSTVCGLST